MYNIIFYSVSLAFIAFPTPLPTRREREANNYQRFLERQRTSSIIREASGIDTRGIVAPSRSLRI